MKKLLLSIVIMMLSIVMMAQAPQKMNFQVLVRNSNNELVTNQTISIEICVLDGSNKAVYTETQDVTTNTNGVATFVVGEGTATKGTFSIINWSAGKYSLQTKANLDGDADVIIDTTPLLSVPYALYTETARTINSIDSSIYASKGQRYTKAEIDALLTALESKISEDDVYSEQGSSYDDSGEQGCSGNGVNNGMEYVDLGLSVKWATCNIGASKPEEGGNRYAWGETVPKSEYTWDTYKYYDATKNDVTKYTSKSSVDESVLEKNDDVAYTTLGGDWRMPYPVEWCELFHNCTMTFTKKNGEGYVVEFKAPNGNYILMPVDWYWTSHGNGEAAREVSSDGWIMNTYRYKGLLVRPVLVDEVINAPFSVSADKQVYFSRGNLQYNASTNTWRFAEHQYDIADIANGNWNDLFGWGTSGYNGKDPRMRSTSYSDYGVEGDVFADIAGTNYDWGVYNAISNGGNNAGMWRTLTYSEWNYLLFERPDANSLKFFAEVNGVLGLILLPDNWTTPDGFKLEEYYTNGVQWLSIETKGAVFLPAAGYRSDTGRHGGYFSLYHQGNYWSASAYGNLSYCMNFYYQRTVGMAKFKRHYSQSVRLVKDVK